MQTEYTTFAPHLANLIDDHDTIIIHRHVKPDPDAIGSANGLAHLIGHNMPDKRYLLPILISPLTSTTTTTSPPHKQKTSTGRLSSW